MKHSRSIAALLAASALLLTLFAGCGIPELSAEKIDSEVSEPAEETPAEEPEPETVEEPEPESEPEPETEPEPEAEPLPDEPETGWFTEAGTQAGSCLDIYNAFVLAEEHAALAEQAAELAEASGSEEAEEALTEEAPDSGFTSGTYAALCDGTVVILSGSDLMVLTANGKDSALASQISLADVLPESAVLGDTCAVFAAGSTAAVVFEETGDDGQERTHTVLYSLADPTVPELSYDLITDGRYLGAAATESSLLVLTSMAADISNEDDESGFIPTVTENGEDALLPAEDFFISPLTGSLDLTLLTSVSLDSEQPGSIFLALTGYYGSSALTGNTVVLASAVTSVTSADPVEETPYSVTEAVSSCDTELVAIDAETLVPAAWRGLSGNAENGIVLDGEVLCFSLNTTVLRYAIYEDARYGFVNPLFRSETDDSAEAYLTAALEDTAAPVDNEAAETDVFTPDLPEKWIAAGVSPEDIVTFSSDSLFYFCSEYGMIAADETGAVLAEVDFSFG